MGKNIQLEKYFKKKFNSWFSSTDKHALSQVWVGSQGISVTHL